MPDIKIVDEQGAEVVEEAREINSDHIALLASEGEPSRVAVAQVLGVGLDDIADNKENLDILVKWASTQTEDHSMQNLKWVIKRLEMKLGTPVFGESSVTKTARYARLDMDGKRIDKQKEMEYAS